MRAIPIWENRESPTRAIERVKRWSAEPDYRLGSACYHNGLAFSRTASAVRASPMNGTFVHKLSIRKRRSECAMTLQWHIVAGQTTEATSVLLWLHEVTRFLPRVTSRQSIAPSSTSNPFFPLALFDPYLESDDEAISDGNAISSRAQSRACRMQPSKRGRTNAVNVVAYICVGRWDAECIPRDTPVRAHKSRRYEHPLADVPLRRNRERTTSSCRSRLNSSR